MATEPHYFGHRTRLRQRFLTGEILADYELLELLLFQGNPRRDTKPIAKKLLDFFGNLERVLSAATEDLQKTGLNPASITALKLTYNFHLNLLKHAMFQRETIDTYDRISTYCHRKLAPLNIEVFYVIYMDTHYGVIYEEVHNKGSLNHVAVYPRDIIKTALERGAAKIILAHNHPGGDPKPSFEDLQLTHKLIELGKELEVIVLDHIIIGHSSIVSLKGLGHI